MKWKKNISILMALIISVMALGLASAYDFDPGRDINLRDLYDIKNVVDGDFACLNLSGDYRCVWASDPNGTAYHNTLTDIQGGTETERYHVNESIYNRIVSFVFSWITGDYFDQDLNTTDDVTFRNITASNITASNINADYFYGQPITGGIGSGIIEADEFLECGCMNITDDGVSEVVYPTHKHRIVNTDGTTNYCNITGDTVNVTALGFTVYYVDASCTIQSDTFSNFYDLSIRYGNYSRIFDVYKSDGGIEESKGATLIGLENRKNRRLSVNCKGGGHLTICDGMNIQENTFPYFNQTAGDYVHINTELPTTLENTETNGIHFVYRSGGDWVHADGTGINLSSCDDGSDLVDCSDSKYRRYFVGSIGWSDTKIHQLAALDSETFNNIGNCLDTINNPLIDSYIPPPNDKGILILHHVYCGRRDDLGWTGSWMDLREGITGFGVSQDLSIFLTTDGARPLIANWDAGSYNITASWFKGQFNWTEDSIYLSFDGSTLSLSESQLNSTIDARAGVAYFAGGEYLYLNVSNYFFLNETRLNETIDSRSVATEVDPYWTQNYSDYNDSWSSTYNSTYDTWAYNQTVPAITYADDTFITLANEGNLDVNRSDYWDDLNLPSDITGLIDSQISNTLTINASGAVTWAALTSYPATCSGSQYISALGDTIVCSAISITESQISDFGSYYLESNPFGFYNSTNPQTETDPLAYNGTLMYASNWNATNTSYMLNTGDTATGNYTFDSTTFHIDSSGNKVGIGTNDPRGKLQINTSADSAGLILATSVDNSNSSYILFADRSGINIGAGIKAISIGGYGRKGLAFYVGGDASWTSTISNLTEAMRIDNVGKVGIGTPTPQNTLNVIGDGNFTGDLYVGDQLTVSGEGTFSNTITAEYFVGDGSGLTGIIAASTVWNRSAPNMYPAVLTDKVAIGTTAVSSGQLEVYRNASNAEIVIHEDYGTHDATLHLRRGGDDWQITHNQNLSFQFEEAEKMVIRQDGNVGIGTTNPGAKLHVNSSDGTEIKVENIDSNNWALFGMGTDNNARAAYLLTYGSNHSLGNHTALKNLWGDILFYTGTGGIGNTEKMRITSAGNVGIGTTTPQNKLNVIGDGNFTGNFIVDENTFFIDSVNNEVGIGISDFSDSMFYINSSIATAQTWNRVDNKWILYIQEVDGLGLYTGVGQKYAWFATNDGEVGINKSGADTALDVNGVITATGGISTEWNTAYTHSQDNTQAHTDYMLNTGDIASGTYNFDSNTLVVDAPDDKVGFGTATPTYGKAEIFSATEGAGEGLAIYNGTGSTFRIWRENDVAYLTRTATATKGISIDSTGEVGIGPVTSFVDQLTVIGNGTNDAAYFVFNSTYGNQVEIGAEAFGIAVIGSDGPGVWSYVSGDSTAIYGRSYNGIAGYFNSDSGGYALITGDGNVGIGTVSPSYPLEVENADNILALFNSTDSRAGIAIKDVDDTYFLGTESDKFFLSPSGTLATADMVIDSTGKVGIGTTIPATALDVNGVITATGGTSTEWNLGYDHSIDNTQAHTDYMLNTGDIATGNYEITGNVYMKAGGQIGFEDAAPTGSIYLYNDGGATSRLNIGGTMWVEEAGNVGIGTSGPNGKLAIRQGMSNYSIAFTSPHIKLTATDAVNDVGFVGITYAGSSSANYGWSVGALRSSAGQSSFVWKYHNNLASGVEYMRIDKDGKVGIGDTSPGEKLEVAGNINSTGGDICITGGNCLSDAGEVYTAGDHLTLTGNEFDVDDDFLLNTGDTMEGILTIDRNVAGANLLIYGDSNFRATFYPDVNDIFNIYNYDGVGATWGDIQIGKGSGSVGIYWDASAGNVGIGDTTPGSALEVTGNITLSSTNNCILFASGGKICSGV